MYMCDTYNIYKNSIYSVNRSDKIVLGDKRGVSSLTNYIPQLPEEGIEDELDTYRTLAQEMIMLINVRPYI